LFVTCDELTFVRAVRYLAILMLMDANKTIFARPRPRPQATIPRPMDSKYNTRKSKTKTHSSRTKPFNQSINQSINLSLIFRVA